MKGFVINKILVEVIMFNECNDVALDLYWLNMQKQ